MSGYIMYALVEAGVGEHYASVDFETETRTMPRTRVLIA